MSEFYFTTTWFDFHARRRAKTKKTAAMAKQIIRDEIRRIRRRRRRFALSKSASSPEWFAANHFAMTPARRSSLGRLSMTRELSDSSKRLTRTIVSRFWFQGSPSTCIGNLRRPRRPRIVIFTSDPCATRTGRTDGMRTFNWPSWSAPETATISKTPSSMREALKLFKRVVLSASSCHHIRQPPLNELIFKRTKPSVSSGNSIGTPSTSTKISSRRPAKECSMKSRDPKIAYRSLLVSSCAKSHVQRSSFRAR